MSGIRFGGARSEDRAGRRDRPTAGALTARGAGLLIVSLATALVSRMEFHGLGSVASERLLTRDFGSRLAGVSANPAASLAASGSVVRYLGDDRALVRTPHGLEVDTSSVPLRVAHDANVLQPVSLKLHEVGTAYTAANPLQSVSVSRRLSGGVTVGSAGIRLVPQGSDASGSLIGDQSVFFPSVAADEDASIAPTIRGVDLSTVLRSQLSPELISYRVVLPTGATLLAHHGGAVVLRAGRRLASVPATVAWDAQGTAVPISMSVSGDNLLLSVRHRRRDVAYPVLVDPEVVIITESAEGWRFAGEGTGSPPGDGSPLTAEISGTYPIEEPCFAGDGICGGFGGSAEWVWELGAPIQHATGRTHLKTEFDDVSFSASTPAEHPEDARWHLSGFCGTYSEGGNGGINSNNPPSATEIIAATDCEPEQERVVEVGVEAGQNKPFHIGERVPRISASASISVGAILVSESGPEHQSEEYAYINPNEPLKPRCMLGHPVNCATGNQTTTQTDLTVGGRGLGLNLARTYNSQLAAKQTEHGPFGYGWTGSYSAHLELSHEAEEATVYQNNGSTATFVHAKKGNPGPRLRAWGRRPLWMKAAGMFIHFRIRPRCISIVKVS
jgi:hypothetical protein